MDTYNTRTWLNTANSHYTGSIVCHDGVVSNLGKPPTRYTFVEISSCHTKARIHYDENLDMASYITKLKIIQHELQQFIDYLEQPHVKNNS